jgi:CheY-like chemotaxis protein
MEAVGQLTGGMAHDFNSLLAIIQGNAEILAEALEGHQSETGAILRASARGAELTQRLLAFSRRQPLHPQAIDLADLVASLASLMKRTLGEIIEVKTVADAGLWLASADPGQVENALLNLAINARDAMPDGGKLEIGCRNERLDDAFVARNPEVVAGDYVVLIVGDTGTGMSPEVAEHAFEPFYTTKAAGRGSGVGLSMVYGFAKQSGGHVSLDSELGRGTTVRLYLPRTEDAATGEVAPAGDEVPRGAGETVLLIEDDEDVRTLTVEMLERLGYRVIDVADAADGRTVLDGGEPVDLILSDVVLPGGLSGARFAQEVRARDPGLPIILVSGYAAEAAQADDFSASDWVLLNKPFKTGLLAKALRKALG